MGVNRDFWLGKRVFLTGHTGFKGAWLALWLAEMGAEVHGYALAPSAGSSLFAFARVRERIRTSTIADLRDAESLSSALQASNAAIVLHLAAQPIVRQSYAEPAATFAVNVMGTVNLYEAVRKSSTVRAIVNVTTDKCYENREWAWPYRENDPLGGADPYSSSKACSELVTVAYRRSFLAARNIHVATARAGNVIGGGDWAMDRLIPDFLRAMDAGRALVVRSPRSIRPWQHVLEPLAGYLSLAEKLWLHGASFADSWNFGPDETDARSVQWIVEHLCHQVPGATWKCDDRPHQHEAVMLKLDSAKARAELGWRPRWSLPQALSRTVTWHQSWRAGEDLSIAQILEYEAHCLK